MKKRPEIMIFLKNKIILIIASFLIVAAACRSDEKKGLIPEKTFSRILYEIYMTDGLLALPDIHEKYYPRDSLANYADIAESYGYTKEAVDNTLKYYFTKKPKKLIKIYDHAIARLTEMETKLNDETIESPAAEGGLWKGAQVYDFAGISDTARLYFDHVFYSAGDYIMKYTLTLYPSDETVNSRLTAFICRADSLASGRRNYFSGIKYLRDGQPHTYNFLIRIPNNLPILIKGRLLDFENDPAGILRHAKVENISFTLISLLK